MKIRLGDLIRLPPGIGSSHEPSSSQLDAVFVARARFARPDALRLCPAFGLQSRRNGELLSHLSMAHAYIGRVVWVATPLALATLSARSRVCHNRKSSDCPAL